MKDTPTPDSLRPGSVVGPWRIEGYAGNGTYGVVYRARHGRRPASPPVALKLAMFAHDPRFAREAELLSRLQHPAMPKLLDRGSWVAGPEAAHPYLVMEWIRGLPLYAWGSEYEATPRKALQVLAQVAWQQQWSVRGRRQMFLCSAQGDRWCEPRWYRSVQAPLCLQRSSLKSAWSDLSMDVLGT